MLQQSCFSEVLHEDVTVHFQLICMPNQLFVWISHGPTQLGQLCAAMPQARSLVAAEHQRIYQRIMISRICSAGHGTNSRPSQAQRRCTQQSTGAEDRSACFAGLNLSTYHIWLWLTLPRPALAFKTGKPAICSCCLPPDKPLLQVSTCLCCHAR